jgi:hypothetical protein
MEEAHLLKLEQQSVKSAKQKQPSCRLIVQAVSMALLTAASLVLTNYGRANEPMQTPLDTDPIATPHPVPLPMRQMCSSGMDHAQGEND